MSTLEYTISMLETMPEDKLREVQKYIQYLIFKDMSDIPMESFNEDIIGRQLTESMKKAIWELQHQLISCHSK